MKTTIFRYLGFWQFMWWFVHFRSDYTWNRPFRWRKARKNQKMTRKCEQDHMELHLKIGLKVEISLVPWLLPSNATPTVNTVRIKSFLIWKNIDIGVWPLCSFQDSKCVYFSICQFIENKRKQLILKKISCKWRRQMFSGTNGYFPLNLFH